MNKEHFINSEEQDFLMTGTVKEAVITPYKGDVSTFKIYLTEQLNKLQQRARIKLGVSVGAFIAGITTYVYTITTVTGITNLLSITLTPELFIITVFVFCILSFFLFLVRKDLQKFNVLVKTQELVDTQTPTLNVGVNENKETEGKGYVLFEDICVQCNGDYIPLNVVGYRAINFDKFILVLDKEQKKYGFILYKDLETGD